MMNHPPAVRARAALRLPLGSPQQQPLHRGSVGSIAVTLPHASERGLGGGADLHGTQRLPLAGQALALCGGHGRRGGVEARAGHLADASGLYAVLVSGFPCGTLAGVARPDWTEAMLALVAVIPAAKPVIGRALIAALADVVARPLGALAGGLAAVGVRHRSTLRVRALGHNAPVDVSALDPEPRVGLGEQLGAMRLDPAQFSGNLFGRLALLIGDPR